jgi:hypothetical protein
MTPFSLHWSFRLPVQFRCSLDLAPADRQAEKLGCELTNLNSNRKTSAKSAALAQQLLRL